MDFQDEALDIYNELTRYSPTEIDDAVAWLTNRLQAVAEAYASQRN